MRSKPLILAAALAVAAHHPPADAAPCSGFTDVDTADSYCGAVEWLKNRGITLGCGGTEYCPLNNVSRAQMALFMNRLGKALTPVVLYAEQPIGTWTIAASNGGTKLCITTPYTVEDFPRTATFAGQFFGHPNPGPAWLQGRIMFTTNDGAAWDFVGGAGTMYGRDWAGTAQVAGSAVFARPMELDPETTYRFAIGVDGAGASYTFTPLVCQFQVTIHNANPSVSPLDD